MVISENRFIKTPGGKDCMWTRNLIFTRSFRMAAAGKRKSGDGGSGAAAAKKGHWSAGLKTSIDDPELRVDSDELCTTIKDKYPKARFHYLVLPKEAIPNMKALTPDHIPLLKHLEQKGKDIAKTYGDGLEFRYGYHAIPSMSLLHLHVISQDFDSPCLKTKKHWNSFTTAYFIDSQDVIQMMKDNGKFQVDTTHYVDMLKQPLKCHVCKKDMNTIPALKQHLLGHFPKQK